MNAHEIERWMIESVETRSELHESPFVHAHLRDFLPPDVYTELTQNWPDTGWQELVHPDQLKPDGTYRRRQLRVLDAWPELGIALEGPALLDAFSRVLRRPVQRAFPQALLLDDEAGYWIRPHPDTRNKQITVQVYLPDTDAHPEMGTWMMGRAQPDSRFVEYRPNTGFAFPVTQNSNHEVKAGACTAPRRSLQVLYYDSERPNIRYK